MMNENDRASLAEQLVANPLWDVLMDEQERSAVERMVNAATDITRLECQLRVLAVRSFRADCEASLRSTRQVKSAPA